VDIQIFAFDFECNRVASLFRREYLLELRASLCQEKHFFGSIMVMEFALGLFISATQHGVFLFDTSLATPACLLFASSFGHKR
jgi:hypothetical protein